MLKAVLFDMDGVIVDSEPLHKKAYYKMFKDVDIDVSETLFESFTGQSTLKICKTLCNDFSLTNNPEELVYLKRKHFKYIFENDTDLNLIDGVLDLIKDYTKNGLILVLASSASMITINNIFNRFKLDKYFISKLSGADLRASKPHPEIFINAAKSSGFKKEECLVIEDSTNGIKSAKAAGIYCIGFDSFYSKNQDYSSADLIVKDLSQITYDKIKTLF
ncbi:HAD family phosphatase [Flavobacteriaceae bacterium]|nr:HAD family phosphatase [Flavobacteriaceae bacterium]MDB9712777.1 HAD family phosphatase [Flavobacteriaceae bacterium]MDC1491764.1 HAD family phosphatase [Flavobacteriaceae bacterium]